MNHSATSIGILCKILISYPTENIPVRCRN